MIDKRRNVSGQMSLGKFIGMLSPVEIDEYYKSHGTNAPKYIRDEAEAQRRREALGGQFSLGPQSIKITDRPHESPPQEGEPFPLASFGPCL
jgi:hypothetical protein